MASTTLLNILSSLLAREHTTSFDPLLSTTLLSIADHLTDEDTAKLPPAMMGQHDLTPTSPDWLNNWKAFINSNTLLGAARPNTRRAFNVAIAQVYESVRDMPKYRKPLADLVLAFMQKHLSSAVDNSDTFCRIIADEAVIRIVDGVNDSDPSVEAYLQALVDGATQPEEGDSDDIDTASMFTVDTHSPSPQVHYNTPSAASPVLSRMHSEYPPKEKDSGLPSVMSILSSFATGNSSRSQSVQPPVIDNIPESPSLLDTPSVPQAVSASSALISAFCQLSFTPFVLEKANLLNSLIVYNRLIYLLKNARSSKVRLNLLQFFMRLRADRDHRLYYMEKEYDTDGQVASLSSLIGRTKDVNRDELVGEQRRARPRVAHERDGRRPSRGRGAPSSHHESRSRSRVALVQPPTPQSKPQEQLWTVPESLAFTVTNPDTPSEGVITYDFTGPDGVIVLPISEYLEIILQILTHETDWEILSYVLCHLPVQLSNKHLVCGPKCRQAISSIASTLCLDLLHSSFASSIEQWPVGIKARDAQGLVYHILSVIVAYRRCLDIKQRHLLVEVFQLGLGGQLSTNRCCLHALSLAAFELQSSTTKFMTNILEKLSQIMSNPDNTVDILSFLSILGSQPPLYANFTESDFKLVFGVALQYLQHYNRLGKSLTGSWTLSQHVRILSYYVLYVWFLAIKLPDRPTHIRYITRQLLLANEGNEQVDDATEVCFDWLARYTYASADPRPAASLLSDIVMNPTPSPEEAAATSEKSWVLGNSIVTIRTLVRQGWIEVVSRRPSGHTKFLCRVENAPMVGLGDADPDMLSGQAALLMERDLPKPEPFEGQATTNPPEVLLNTYTVYTVLTNTRSSL